MGNVVSLLQHPARIERDQGVNQDAIEGGYIKLFRTLQDAGFANRPEYVATWVHVLMLATHKPRQTMLGGQTVQLHAGQFVSGRKALAARVGVSEKVMRTVLEFFEREGMISRDTSNAGTVFTVCNYSVYQANQGQPRASDLGQPSGQPLGQLQPSSHAGSSEIGASEKASERASEGPAIRATTQEHNISTDTNVSVVETAAAESTGEQVSESAKKAPACPHEQIIELYHKHLPELRTVIKERWSGTRRNNLAARWKESEKHQSLAFWERYFQALRNHPFYLGDNDRGWRADLGWIVTRRNFDSLLEKFIDYSQKQKQGGGRHA